MSCSLGLNSVWGRTFFEVNSLFEVPLKVKKLELKNGFSLNTKIEKKIFELKDDKNKKKNQKKMLISSIALNKSLRVLQLFRSLQILMLFSSSNSGSKSLEVLIKPFVFHWTFLLCFLRFSSVSINFSQAVIITLKIILSCSIKPLLLLPYYIIVLQVSTVSTIFLPLSPSPIQPISLTPFLDRFHRHSI